MVTQFTDTEMCHQASIKRKKNKLAVFLVYVTEFPYFQDNKNTCYCYKSNISTNINTHTIQKITKKTPKKSSYSSITIADEW